jgi:hypothetical protein
MGQACLTPTALFNPLILVLSEKINNPVGDGHAHPVKKVA